MRRDIADRLQSIACERIRQEYPDKELTQDEIDRIWYSIYGRLCRGESEMDVEAWCRTAPIMVKRK